MSIHQQITALLDGELVDQGAVDELLHVLAVSPEKRALLVEQLKLKRRFAASAASVVPPASADLAIMRGLGAIDASVAPSSADPDVAPAPVPVGMPAAAAAGWLRYLATSAVVLTVVGAFGAGYWMRGDAGAVSTIASNDRAAATALAGARDSIAMLASQLAALDAVDGVTTGDAVTGLAPMAPGGASDRIRVIERSVAGNADGASTNHSSTTHSERVTNDDGASDDRHVPIESAPLRAISEPARPVALDRDPRGEPFSVVPVELAANDPSSSGPLGISLGVRNNFRLSLPRVYGLTPGAPTLLDRELVGSVALGRDERSPLSRLDVGAAFGMTQFGMVLHTNTGGAAVDTIYEQSPQAYYGRAFIAPEIVRWERLSCALEAGGGYSGIGGFGTVGLNLEFVFSEEVSVVGGASTWLLWTSFRNALELSTNVNAHLGVNYSF